MRNYFSAQKYNLKRFCAVIVLVGDGSLDSNVFLEHVYRLLGFESKDNLILFKVFYASTYSKIEFPTAQF